MSRHWLQIMYVYTVILEAVIYNRQFIHWTPAKILESWTLLNITALYTVMVLSRDKSPLYRHLPRKWEYFLHIKLKFGSSLELRQNLFTSRPEQLVRRCFPWGRSCTGVFSGLAYSFPHDRVVIPSAWRERVFTSLIHSKALWATVSVWVAMLGEKKKEKNTTHCQGNPI